MLGQIQEYVFLKNISKDPYMLSRLDWELKPLWYSGAKIETKILEHLVVSAKGKFGYPGKIGNMIDNDWMNQNNYPKYQWQTDYSKHDNELKSFLEGEVALGWEFHLPYEINIQPFFSYRVQDFSFSGAHGFGYYGYDLLNESNPGKRNEYYKITPYWEGHYTNYEDRDPVITYEQLRNFVSIGFCADTYIVPSWHFAFTADYSFWVYVSAMDRHYDKDYKYNQSLDVVSGYCSFDLGVESEYIFSRNHKVGMSVSWQFVPVLIGYTYDQYSDGKYWRKAYGGGISSSVFSLALSYTFSL